MRCQEEAGRAGNCVAFALLVTLAPPSTTNGQTSCRLYHGVPTTREWAYAHGADPRSVVGCTTQGLVRDNATIAACCAHAPPPPQQLTEHAVQACVVETQLMGHTCSLQFCCSVRSPPHDAPPCCGAVVTLRERDWTPLPHASVHALQSPKAEVAQSIGAGVGAAVALA